MRVHILPAKSFISLYLQSPASPTPKEVLKEGHLVVMIHRLQYSPSVIIYHNNLLTKNSLLNHFLFVQGCLGHNSSQTERVTNLNCCAVGLKPIFQIFRKEIPICPDSKGINLQSQQGELNIASFCLLLRMLQTELTGLGFRKEKNTFCFHINIICKTSFSKLFFGI